MSTLCARLLARHLTRAPSLPPLLEVPSSRVVRTDHMLPWAVASSAAKGLAGPASTMGRRRRCGTYGAGPLTSTTANRHYATTTAVRAVVAVGGRPPVPVPHPIDPVLAHVRPPLPPLDTEAKDRILGAVVDRTQTLFREGKTDGAIILPAADVKCILAGINSALAEARGSLDVSLDNPAVKLMLAHYDRFKHTDDPSSPEAVAALAEALKSMTVGGEARSAMAKELLVSISPLSVRCLLPLVTPEKQNTTARLTPEEQWEQQDALVDRLGRRFSKKVVTFRDDDARVTPQNATALLTPEEQSAQQRTIRRVDMNIWHCFSEERVDVPWSGDDALRVLIGHIRRRPTLIEVWGQEHARFASRALSATFSGMVRVSQAFPDDPAMEELPLQEDRDNTGQADRDYYFDETGPTPPRCPISTSPDDIKHVRSVEPPDGAFVPSGCVLRANILNVITGASGAGKTIAALRLAASVGGPCLLYCKGVFHHCEPIDDVDAESTAKVMAIVTRFVRDCAMTTHAKGMVDRVLGLQACRRWTVLRVVVDDMEKYQKELRALCFMHDRICWSLQVDLGVTQVQFLAVLEVQFLVVGTNIRGEDVGWRPSGSEAWHFETVCRSPCRGLVAQPNNK